MKHKGILIFAVVALTLGVFSPAAKADTIGPNCGSCFGNTFTLTFASTGAGTFQIQLIINTNTSTISPLRAAAFKVVGATFTINNSFVNTTGTGNASGFGAASFSGLASGGCTFNPSPGFVCFPGNGTATAGSGITYTFVANVTVTSGTFDTSAGASSVKAAWGTGPGSLTSEDITLQRGTVVPEPGTLALFGIGLLGIGAAIRRRFSA